MQSRAGSGHGRKRTIGTEASTNRSEWFNTLTVKPLFLLRDYPIPIIGKNYALAATAFTFLLFLILATNVFDGLKLGM